MSVATWVLIASLYSNGGVTVPMDSKRACLAAMNAKGIFSYSACVNTLTGETIIKD